MATEIVQDALANAGLAIEAFAQIIEVDSKSVQRWITGLGEGWAEPGGVVMGIVYLL